MEINQILMTFVILKYGQYVVERVLGQLNFSFYSNVKNQQKACEELNISSEDFKKTLAYTNDKYKFGRIHSFVGILAMLLFLVMHGLGFVEGVAKNIASMVNGGEIVTGLLFFGLLGILSMILDLPFDYYSTFVVEQKHGFNKQTIKLFVVDKIKGLILGIVLGASLLSGILYIMSKIGESWWIWAWAVMSGFSLIAVWVYPTLLAPLFNKFEPLSEGELKKEINDLAQKVGFETDELFVMDASKRSSHGNAYFTGFFKKKRIVLFDTLINSLSHREIVAVLAHELGHFKLNHVLWMLIRSVLMTGMMFYLLSLALPQVKFYQAFGLDGISNYGALIVFSLWFSLLDTVLQPLTSWLSRKNEFAADNFAKQQIGNHETLSQALLKLRESNHAMPISHPWYSAYYYSHPPLMERLDALKKSL